jgi:protein-tyrosine-phosphatase
VAGARITVICDQNRARSPLAAALLSRELAERGVHEITVGSAGLTASPDRPAMTDVVEEAARLGLDLTGHRSQRLDAATVEASGLIIAMTRAQADTIGARHDQDVFLRVFLLAELAGLAGMRGDGAPSGTLSERLATLHLRRPLRGLRADDDIPDPVGHGPDVLRATVDRLVALIREAATGLG